RQGANVQFVCRSHPGNLIGLLEQNAFPVDILTAAPRDISGSSGADYADWLGTSESEDARETLAVLGEDKADWLVVDHYALSREWESTVRAGAEKILAIDDIARAHDCDTLLDQNFSERPSERY